MNWNRVTDEPRHLPPDKARITDQCSMVTTVTPGLPKLIVWHCWNDISILDALLDVLPTVSEHSREILLLVVISIIVIDFGLFFFEVTVSVS